MSVDSGSATPRTYRFALLDRTGWLLGLSAAQCIALGLAIFTAGGILQTGAPPALALVPIMGGAAASFSSYRGRRLYEWLPIWCAVELSRLSGASRWRARLPLVGQAPLVGAPDLPPFLRGIRFIDAGPPSWCPGADDIAVVTDRRQGTVSATMPVEGRHFALASREEQERLLAGWGDVLSGFCVERGPVRSIRVTERLAPAGLASHRAFASSNAGDATDDDWDDYEDLLAEVEPSIIGHEALVTVTVDKRRVRRVRADAHGDPVTHAVLEEMRLLSGRLDAAGLRWGPPLSVAQMAVTFRNRLGAPKPARGPRSLAASARLGVHNAGPMACDIEMSHVKVDGALHRAYWIAEWPRLEVPPSWLEPFLLGVGGVRTLCLHYEPVPPSTSQRRIDRDSTRLAADEEQRTRGGFRVGARHRRAQAAVLEREAELVAGYSEMGYVGLVVVTAETADELDRSCAEYEQLAAQAGFELRPLDGQHELGLMCALPIGSGIAPARFS